MASRGSRPRFRVQRLALGLFGFHRGDVLELATRMEAEQRGAAEAFAAVATDQRARIERTLTRRDALEELLERLRGDRERLARQLEQARRNASALEAGVREEVAHLEASHAQERTRLEAFLPEVDRAIAHAEAELSQLAEGLERLLRHAAPEDAEDASTEFADVTAALLAQPPQDMPVRRLPGGRTLFELPQHSVKLQMRGGSSLGAVTGLVVSGPPPRVVGFAVEIEGRLGVVPAADVVAVHQGTVLVRDKYRLVDAAALPEESTRVIFPVSRSLRGQGPAQETKPLGRSDGPRNAELTAAETAASSPAPLEEYLASAHDRADLREVAREAAKAADEHAREAEVASLRALAEDAAQDAAMQASDTEGPSDVQGPAGRGTGADGFEASLVKGSRDATEQSEPAVQPDELTAAADGSEPLQPETTPIASAAEEVARPRLLVVGTELADEHFLAVDAAAAAPGGRQPETAVAAEAPSLPPAAESMSGEPHESARGEPLDLMAKAGRDAPAAASPPAGVLAPPPPFALGDAEPVPVHGVQIPTEPSWPAGVPRPAWQLPADRDEVPAEVRDSLPREAPKAPVSQSPAPRAAERHAAAPAEPRVAAGGASLNILAFIAGKVVGRDLTSSDGQLIAARGTRITPELVAEVETMGLLPEMIVYMTLPEDAR